MKKSIKMSKKTLYNQAYKIESAFHHFLGYRIAKLIVKIFSDNPKTTL
jgi:hypothetical protein